ncbi:hypothetical protein OMAG_001484 [Candidatus Omnitrophus magneticus]|uniref:Uncharacterized protein n=1 Tax=Candidatus Omnitrophus magneticus TaxID=1609969 RepID=A0A0F0CSZ4_9BACT|nr:hypothetical protein OMAG_001484 [Candidatus Omnitrophus magneticus]
MAEKEKKNTNNLMEKYGPALKKFGQDLSEAAKKGEESFSVLSQTVKMQLDILGVTFQKEKLYYEIGKEVANKLLTDTLDVEDLGKYKKELIKLQLVSKKKKEAIAKINASKKNNSKPVSPAAAKPETATTKPAAGKINSKNKSIKKSIETNGADKDE